MLLHSAVRRRYRTKQPDRALAGQLPAASLAVSALQVEALAADGLVALPLDARRQHVHWTHVRTFGAHDVQPWQLTREQFYQHLERCYCEAYPDAASKSGSILQFGLVVKEKHSDALREVDRSEHNHGPTFSSDKHYWRKIRRISAEKYNIHLNAVAHDCYSTMFRYTRCPTAKKQAHEIDPEPFFSAQHPKGDELKELLEIGEKFTAVRAKKRPRTEEPEKTVRSHFGIFFNWIVQHDLRDTWIC
jgi:hypothetical protein